MVQSQKLVEQITHYYLLFNRRAGSDNLNPQQLHDFILVKADNRLSVDDGHRRALKAKIDQFFQCRLVGAHVFLDELNALLR